MFNVEESERARALECPRPCLCVSAFALFLFSFLAFTPCLFLALSGTHCWRYDQSFLQQVYQTIYKAGADGMALAQLSTSMGLLYRMARSALRCLEQNGDVRAILKSYGKLRSSV